MLALGACATTTSTSGEAAAPEADFVKTGEIVYTRGGSAAFSADRVVGPNINFSKRADGSWAGVLKDQLYNVKVSPGRMVANNLLFTWEESLEGFRGEGRLQGRYFRFEVNEQQLIIRASNQSLTLPASGPGIYGNTTNSVQLKGDAATLPPPMPQFALTLMGIFSA
jgi:hypothetical protein